MLNMLSKRLQWYKTVLYIIQRYQQCYCSVQASALTLDTLLSLVPLLATSIALFTAIPSLQHLVIQAEQKLLANFIIDTGHDITGYLQQLSRQAATVSLVGALLLLLTSIKMLYTLNQAFQLMLNARVRQKTYTEIVLSCLFWVFAPILTGIGIAVSSYIMSLPFLANHKQHLNLLRPLLILIPIALNTLAFLFLYVVSPLFIVPLRKAVIGAFCAAILFEISKWLFGLYIIHFPSYQALYGALAAIPLFLIWLYISWQIILLGAIIAQALINKERFRSSIKLDGFTHAICWLGHLWQAQKNEQSLTLDELVAKDNVSYEIEPEMMLEELKKLDFIAVTEQGHYSLAHTINHYSLNDCLHLFPWKAPAAKQLMTLDFSWKDSITPIIDALSACQEQHLNKPLLSIYQAKTL